MVMKHCTEQLQADGSTDELTEEAADDVTKVLLGSCWGSQQSRNVGTQS